MIYSMLFFKWSVLLNVAEHTVVGRFHEKLTMVVKNQNELRYFKWCEMVRKQV